MTQNLWRPATGFFLALWLMLLGVGRSGLFRDPGTFWHTRVGEIILTDGFFTADPFSCTRAGHYWIPHQWLAEVSLARLHRVGGLDAQLLAAVTLLAGLYAWVAGRFLQAGFNWLPTAALLTLVLAASLHHFHVRPHLITLLFLAVTFAVLRDVEAGRARPGRLAWLVPLFLLWTNLHGGMLGGLATLGLAVAGWSVQWWRGRPPLGSRGAVAGAWLVVLLCGLTAVVTPYGARLPGAWLAILGADLSGMIIEHGRLNPFSLEGLATLALTVGYVAALHNKAPAVPWRVTWLVPLFWLTQAFAGVRHAPLFAAVAALALADLLPHTRWAAGLVAAKSDAYVPPAPEPPPTWWQRLARLAVPAALAAAALAVQSADLPVPLVGRGWARLDPNYWPVEVLPELEARAAGRPAVFNSLLYGGFLIRYAPGMRVFIDDRCELYLPDLLPAYVAAERGEPERLEAWAREFGLTLALVPTATPAQPWPLDTYLARSPRWRVVKKTATATLYERVGHPEGSP